MAEHTMALNGPPPQLAPLSGLEPGHAGPPAGSRGYVSQRTCSLSRIAWAAWLEHAARQHCGRAGDGVQAPLPLGPRVSSHAVVKSGRGRQSQAHTSE